MCNPLERTLADARLLATQIQANEGAADTLIKSAEAISNRLSSMKQFKQDVEKINFISDKFPKVRYRLVTELFRENKQIKHLKTENEELKECIDEYQAKVEVIMQKYRDQCRQMMQSDHFDKFNWQNKIHDYENIILSQKDQLYGCVAVMREAARMDEDNEKRYKELTARLENENQTLRELLGIANGYGKKILRQAVMKDANVQTDDESVDRSDTESNGCASRAQDVACQTNSMATMLRLGPMSLVNGHHLGPEGTGSENNKSGEILASSVADRVSSTLSLPDQLASVDDSGDMDDTDFQNCTPPSSPRSFSVLLENGSFFGTAGGGQGGSGRRMSGSGGRGGFGSAGGDRSARCASPTSNLSSLGLQLLGALNLCDQCRGCQCRRQLQLDAKHLRQRQVLLTKFSLAASGDRSDFDLSPPMSPSHDGTESDSEMSQISFCSVIERTGLHDRAAASSSASVSSGAVLPSPPIGPSATLST